MCKLPIFIIALVFFLNSTLNCQITIAKDHLTGRSIGKEYSSFSNDTKFPVPHEACYIEKVQVVRLSQELELCEFRRKQKSRKVDYSENKQIKCALDALLTKEIAHLEKLRQLQVVSELKKNQLDKEIAIKQTELKNQNDLFNMRNLTLQNYRLELDNRMMLIQNNQGQNHH